MPAQFDNSYARLSAQFHTKQPPRVPTNPSLIAYNQSLGASLGFDFTDDSEIAQIFSGAKTLVGGEPLAQLYSGHQFGTYNPQLGDGRALLLGEVIDQHDNRRDIQLRGSGPTPYSRGGDGLAAIGPVIREYLVSEAMHALGIPTTRALAAVTTGDPVYRDDVLPGAVLTRVASSHIRVGTFQVFAARRQYDDLRSLYEYSVARHYPEANDPLEFLQCVINAQTDLIAKWMGIGFIHGVMNTDNCLISGETIDYGPCAFMDAYHPMQVFSSIDRMGRYAFGNQPQIIVWNMAQLATALVPLMPDQDQAIQDFTDAIHAMPEMLKSAQERVLLNKIGITSQTDEDRALVADMLTILAQTGDDFTNFFVDLTHQRPLSEHWKEWFKKWTQNIEDKYKSLELMRQTNPVVIPRNHQIERIIQDAIEGDYTSFQAALETWTNPYDPAHLDGPWTAAPKPEEIVPATFCGT
jgi:uncharacterized protein YdiU (UPF0061 family)